MKKLFLSALLIGSLTVALNAENNNSTKTNSNTENNNSSKANKNTGNNNSTKAKRSEEQIQEQIKREKKYAKEKTFYQGRDYNLSAFEVDKNSLSSIPELEPDYDFNMDDVYSD